MPYRIIDNRPNWTLANSAGDLARDTNGEVYLARSRSEAEEARDYLNQPRVGIEPRKGSHRMKSIFGKE